jgi:hypothetical protein
MREVRSKLHTARWVLGLSHRVLKSYACYIFPTDLQKLSQLVGFGSALVHRQLVITCTRFGVKYSPGFYAYHRNPMDHRKEVFKRISKRTLEQPVANTRHYSST